MDKLTTKISAPLLYRLLDDEPEKTSEKISRRFIDINKLHRDIRANLEMLLNTRFCGLIWPGYLVELEESVLNYGVEDFTQTYFSNKSRQTQLCHSIKQIVQHFEPRLRSVSVGLLDNDLELERMLKVRIEGMIHIKPKPVPAVFESCLDVTRQEFEFEREGL